jgi:hypothetical protein
MLGITEFGTSPSLTVVFSFSLLWNSLSSSRALAISDDYVALSWISGPHCGGARECKLLGCNTAYFRYKSIEVSERYFASVILV